MHICLNTNKSILLCNIEFDAVCANQYTIAMYNVHDTPHSITERYTVFGNVKHGISKGRDLLSSFLITRNVLPTFGTFSAPRNDIISTVQS